MKIYISGKVTGLERHIAISKFEHSKKQLIEAGIPEENIYNPLEHVPEGSTWEEAMSICLPALRKCNAIFMQRDWRDSFGARRELNDAMELRFDCFFEESGDIRTISNMINLAVLQ